MKKRLLAFAVLIGAAAFIWADSTTSRFGLTIPTVGSANWAPKLNNNFTIIDNAGGLSLNNTWTSTNTFNGFSRFNGSTQFTGSVTFSGQVNPSSISITGLSPGVMKVIATSSNVVTGLVSLSSETIGRLSISTQTTALTSTNTWTAGQTFSSATITSLSVQNLTATVVNSSTITASSSMTVTGNGLQVTGTSLNLGTSTEFKPGLASSTSGQMLVSQGANLAPKFQWNGRIGAMGLGLITNSTATTATTFVNTNLTCSITPLTSGSTVFIFVSGFSQSGNGDQGNLTLTRDSTNIAGSNGFYRQISPAALSIMAGASFFGSDAVVTAGSPQVYTVQMKSGSGASYQFCETNARCTILAIEITGP